MLHPHLRRPRLPPSLASERRQTPALKRIGDFLLPRQDRLRSSRAVHLRVYCLASTMDRRLMTFASVHETTQRWIKGREFTDLNTSTLSGVTRVLVKRFVYCISFHARNTDIVQTDPTPYSILSTIRQYERAHPRMIAPHPRQIVEMGFSAHKRGKLYRQQRMGWVYKPVWIVS